MKEEQHRFLMLSGQLPARLTVEQTAWLLNCQVHDMPALMGAKLLRPIGNPPPNAIKFFATLDVLELAKDRSWLTKMTNTITQHWRTKNASRRNRALVSSATGESPAALRDGSEAIAA
jgi:hypothetical protein